MINKKNAKAYCCEDISLIENYNEAINSDEMWDCHHRLEIQNDVILNRNELISIGKYYKVFAKDLIFIPKTEHRKMHNRFPKHTNEWYEKIKSKNSGPRSEETKQKLRKPKRRHKWLTPTGEIIEMSGVNAKRYHPDWTFLE